jgi:hypothetical protein
MIAGCAAVCESVRPDVFLFRADTLNRIRESYTLKALQVFPHGRTDARALLVRTHFRLVLDGSTLHAVVLDERPANPSL